MAENRSQGYLPRRAARSVLAALADTRVVLVNGARQSGKSTLVRQIGKETGAVWYSLDDSPTRDLAASDPAAFVRLNDRMIIDEIQRDPELLLTIKSLVDEQPNPGRFLLTGSARVLGLRELPDTLIGRMETIELWPLSQGEIDGTSSQFIDHAFELGPQLRYESSETRDGYLQRIVRGGFPDAYHRPEARRQTYLRGYVSDIINRDVIQLSDIRRGTELRYLVNTLAALSGQTIVPAKIATDLGVDGKTVKNYLRLLEEVYLIKRIPAWTRRISSRSVGLDKVAFVDSGIASALLNQTATRLRKPGAPLGGLFESFVTMEIARQIQWSNEHPSLYHYRTKDGDEVDIILENGMGQVIAIEVKASTTPRSDDFKSLSRLETRLGNDFIAGYLVYSGTKTLPFGPKMRAIPASALWNSEGE